MTTVVYKIRRKSDGLFSTGGSVPSWTENGKTWNTRGALSNHMAQLRDPYYSRTRRIDDIYGDAEVVVIEVVYNPVNAIPALEWTVTAKTAMAKAAQAKRQAEYRATMIEGERARLLARLAEIDENSGKPGRI